MPVHTAAKDEKDDARSTMHDLISATRKSSTRVLEVQCQMHNAVHPEDMSLTSLPQDVQVV
jgi:hypothetical protein